MHVCVHLSHKGFLKDIHKTISGDYWLGEKELRILLASYNLVLVLVIKICTTTIVTYQTKIFF